MASDDQAIDRATVAKIAAGFLVALVILYLFGVVFGWREIRRTLRSANLNWFALALASTTVGLVSWAKAWDEILELVDVDCRCRRSSSRTSPRRSPTT